MDFAGLVKTMIDNVLTPLVALIIAAAVVYFLWGVVKYINKVGKEEDRETGKKMMIYGVIAIFVMISIWGLVHILAATFQFDTSTPTTPTVPQF
jgi:phosphotransferase system  glucose/maltose/N-acetylglucosamine-specific IIC component